MTTSTSLFRTRGARRNRTPWHTAPLSDAAALVVVHFLADLDRQIAEHGARLSALDASTRMSLITKGWNARAAEVNRAAQSEANRVEIALKRAMYGENWNASGANPKGRRCMSL